MKDKLVMKRKKLVKMPYGGYKLLGEEEIDPIASRPIVGSGKLNPMIDPAKVQASAIPTAPITTQEVAAGQDLSKPIIQGINSIKSAASGVAGKISSGLDMVNGFVGAIQSAQQFRQEQARVIASRNNVSTPAYQEDELNNIPIFTKYGGGPSRETGGPKLGKAAQQQALDSGAAYAKNWFDKRPMMQGFPVDQQALPTIQVTPQKVINQSAGGEDTGLKNSKTLGYYNSNTNQIKISDDQSDFRNPTTASKDIGAHEMTHAIQQQIETKYQPSFLDGLVRTPGAIVDAFSMGLPAARDKMHNEARAAANPIDYSYSLIDKVPKLTDNKYLTQPHEVHARLMEWRRATGTKPTEVITPELYKERSQILRKSKNQSYGVDQLYQTVGDNDIIDLLNKTAYNEGEKEDTGTLTAKYGGGPKMAAGGGTQAVRNYQTFLNKKFGTQLPISGRWDEGTQRAYEQTGKLDYTQNIHEIMGYVNGTAKAPEKPLPNIGSLETAGPMVQADTVGKPKVATVGKLKIPVKPDLEGPQSSLPSSTSQSYSKTSVRQTDQGDSLLTQVGDYAQAIPSYLGRQLDRFSSDTTTSKTDLVPKAKVTSKIKPTEKAAVKPVDTDIMGGLPLITKDSKDLGAISWKTREHQLGASDLVNLNEVSMGTRNRGEYPKDAGDIEINTLQPFKQGKLDPNKFYIGTKGDKLVTGKGDTLQVDKASEAPFFNAETVGANNEYAQSWKYNYPVMRNGDKALPLNISTSKDLNSAAYSRFAGGSTIIETPDGKHRYAVRGSVDQVKTVFDQIKQKTGHKNLNVYITDNGAYSTGLKTADGVSTESEMKAYEAKHTTGSHGAYFKRKMAYGGQAGSVEAEDGEIVEHGDGSIVALDGPTHEQGGIDLSNVERVLEDTSTKRKDPLSKALKIEGTSHAKLFEKEAKKLENTQNKYLKAIKSVEEKKRPSNLSTNAAQLNATFAQQLPTKTDIFDALFQHQEQVKQEQGYDYDEKGNLVKAKYGTGDPLKPWKGSKKKTDTGKTDEFKGDFNKFQDSWRSTLDPSAYTTEGMMQMGVYKHLMGSDDGKKQLREMWKTYGNTDQGKYLGLGKDYDWNNLTDQQLSALRPAYVDGKLGARSLSATPISRIPTPEPIVRNQQPQLPMTGISARLNPDIIPQAKPLPPQEEPLPKVSNTPGKPVNDGMKWYDLAGSLAAFAASGVRDPELFNPAEAHRIKLIQNDVRPYLASNQAEYNAAKAGVRPGSVGDAQAAQLYSNKVEADNKALAQVQQSNNGIINQQEMYNAQVDDRQSLLDQNSRESYYNKVLTARSKQQEQRLQAIDAFADAHAKHDSFNRTSDLIQKLAPHFNKNADYNGKQDTFTANANIPGQTQGGVPAGAVKYRITTKDGNVTTTFMTPEEYNLRIRNPSSNIKSAVKIGK